MHANFSTLLREVGGKEYFEQLMPLRKGQGRSHRCLWPDNHMRLTGLHETQSIDQFSYGLLTVALRSACRIASLTMATKLPRRPPSELSSDPYQIASRILKTIATCQRP